ncbi:MAG: hypothetical protein ACI4SG_06470 [Oligosphaeraceae bacterium]
MNDTRRQTLLSWGAMAFLASLFLPFPPGGKVLLSELFAPLMLWQCWRQRKRLGELCRHEFPCLVFAALWMLLATVDHYLRGCGSLYDLAVFAYMGLIFLFLRLTPLPSPRASFRCGAVLLAILWAGWALTKILSVQGTCLEGLLYFDRHFAALEPNALVTRYQFLFPNPNLLGGAYILPVLFCLPWLSSWFAAASPGKRAACVAAGLLAFLPLLATASKMSVMTLGLLTGGLAMSLPSRRRLAASLALAVTLAFGTLCLVTVFFRTYPAIRQSPWVDFHQRGNYSVHQEIYGRIFLESSWREKLLGHDAARLRALYPRHAREDRIREILKPYGFEGETELYATFMDPHCEYLNLLSFFGIPALLAVTAYLLRLAARGARAADYSLALLALGVLFAFFWEDVASKRFLWAALGIAAARLPRPAEPPGNGVAGHGYI